MDSSSLFSASCIQWLPLGIPLQGLSFLESLIGFLTPFFLIPAVLLLFVGWRLKSGRGQSTKRIISKVLLSLGGGLLFLFCMMVYAEFLRMDEAEYREACAGNFYYWGCVYEKFSKENDGMYYPELSPEAGCLMFALGKNRGIELAFPGYLSDPTLLVCGGDVRFMKALFLDLGNLNAEALKPLLNDRWFMYLGYVLQNDREVTAFAKAYRERVASGKRFDEDLKVPQGEGNCGTDTVYQLRACFDDVVANLARSHLSKSKIPVMIERVENNHDPKGGHVLYMDGHVAYLPYPGKWPMTETTMTTLEELANMDGKPPVVQKPEEDSSGSRILVRWLWRFMPWRGL